MKVTITQWAAYHYEDVRLQLTQHLALRREASLGVGHHRFHERRFVGIRLGLGTGPQLETKMRGRVGGEEVIAYLH